MQHGTGPCVPTSLHPLSDRLSLMPSQNTSMNNSTSSSKPTMGVSSSMTEPSDSELVTLAGMSSPISEISMPPTSPLVANSSWIQENLLSPLKDDTNLQLSGIPAANGTMGSAHAVHPNVWPPSRQRQIHQRCQRQICLNNSLCDRAIIEG